MISCVLMRLIAVYIISLTCFDTRNATHTQLREEIFGEYGIAGCGDTYGGCLEDEEYRGRGAPRLSSRRHRCDDITKDGKLVTALKSQLLAYDEAFETAKETKDDDTALQVAMNYRRMNSCALSIR